MTRDPLLLDEGDEGLARDWVPFEVAVRQVGAVLEVAVRGEVDAWTGGALLRHLAAGWTPSVTEVRVDLTNASCSDRSASEALERCTAFGAERGASRVVIQRMDADGSGLPRVPAVGA